jgi:eukaryotic-like serine/threonine-protein kinase
MALSAGDRLGPYEILAPVGAGGMGEVWKARDTRLDRMVAVKKLNGQHLQRFEKEARAVAALNHPNICQLYDVGPDYLVLEFVEGRTLRGPLPVDEAVRLAIQIAEALQEAHRRGISHRDLKPGNIMVTPDGAVKLLDFGLAKQAPTIGSDATLTMEGTVMGTAAYMAPEQAEGKAADARSDIFSFGAVLYEMLSGRRAFAGESAISTMAAILHKEPPPLDGPPHLAQIVARCLRKAPAERFQTIAEVRTALVGAGHGQPAHQQPSIAVLPFANMSADKENEYFSDGLAEEIINVLVQVPGLKVTARTSSFAFQGQKQDVRKIAETLGVRTILEGSVRRAGNRIRVTAQLINAADGYHLWSERYDRELADVFAVQDEIGAAIAAALQVKLSGNIQRYRPGLPAYEAYLKGRHHVLKMDSESLALAKHYFEQAIALDPGFALAHCALGIYYWQLTLRSLLPAHEAMPAIRAAARKALEIDTSLPEAHALLGMVAAYYDYDWKEAESRLRAAMAHTPVPPLVRGIYAGYLLSTGRSSEAVEQMTQSLREDPLDVPGHMVLAQCLRAAGRLAEAGAAIRQSLELDPNFFPAYTSLCFGHASQGQLAEAVIFAEKAYALAPRNPQPIGALAGILARIGNRSRAEEVLQQLGNGQAYGAPTGLIIFYTLFGDTEKAADWFERSIEQRYPLTPMLLRLMPMLSGPSPRWAGLAKMMNLPEISAS